MGLFLGLLLLLINPGNFMIVGTSILMGIVFFTVWTVIGYAMTGGKRDFTSMTSTIPMQYELLVEHKHAAQARQILADSGAGPLPAAATGDRADARPLPPLRTEPASTVRRPRSSRPSRSRRRRSRNSPRARATGSPPPTAVPAPEHARGQRPSFGRPAGEPTRPSVPSEPPASDAPRTASFGAPGPSADAARPPSAGQDGDQSADGPSPQEPPRGLIPQSGS